MSEQEYREGNDPLNEEQEAVENVEEMVSSQDIVAKKMEEMDKQEQKEPEKASKEDTKEVPREVPESDIAFGVLLVRRKNGQVNIIPEVNGLNADHVATPSEVFNLLSESFEISRNGRTAATCVEMLKPILRQAIMPIQGARRPGRK